MTKDDIPVPTNLFRMLLKLSEDEIEYVRFSIDRGPIGRNCGLKQLPEPVVIIGLL